uniref:Uncharacterized protein n=1 Tax=Arundo donax TaxID=35708 RepID=A0A0A8YNI7_ARUDO
MPRVCVELFSFSDSFSSSSPLGCRMNSSSNRSQRRTPWLALARVKARRIICLGFHLYDNPGGISLSDRSRQVCPSLFARSMRTFQFVNRGKNVSVSPAFTARCSAVFPLLSCMFRIQSSDGVRQACFTTLYLFLSTAT